MDEFVDSFVSQLASQGAFMSVFIIVNEIVIVYNHTIQIMYLIKCKCVMVYRIALFLVLFF